MLTKVPAKNKVTVMGCGSNFSLFYTENNELYAVGSNNEGRCGLNWNSGTANPSLVEFSK